MQFITKKEAVMEKYIYSDLIIESSQIRDVEKTHFHSEEYVRNIKVIRDQVPKGGDSRTYIANEGLYTTIELPELFIMEPQVLETVATVLSNEITRIVEKTCNRKINKDFSVLIAGIGNRNITPDAIGPLSVEKLNVTRHISLLDAKRFETLDSCKVCAVSCGVMGETGMETLEIIKGILSQIDVDAVISIDALAARGANRLAKVIQLSNLGISPGAGIGNRRQAINDITLGVPVIAIGAPTVISASVLLVDTLTRNGINNLNKTNRLALERGKEFFVTPKNCDAISESLSSIIARSIDKAFCGI